MRSRLSSWLPRWVPAEKRGRPGHEGAALAVMAILFYALVVVRTAWISDDAYITFRTLDNFANGYGLTWNAGERVQAFTHPLWALVLSALHSYSSDFYLTAIFVSIVLSLATAAIVAFGTARPRTGGFLGIAMLALSRAFVDYSTSGLENPLTHVLLAVFCLILFRCELDLVALGWLSVVAALATVNRMDAILYFLPALAAAAFSLRRAKAAVVVALGFTPFALWEIFSLVYYGFLFPNTAYAKLYTGLTHGELIGQGLRYLLDACDRDPLTPFVLAAALLSPWVLRSWRVAALAAGIGLSLLYIVWIGGDFMSGRFLSAPLLLGAILLSRLPVGRHPVSFLASLGVVTLLGIAAPEPTFLSGSDYGHDFKALGEQVDRTGISDERAVYYPVTGLLRAEPKMPVPTPRQRWVAEALAARADGRRVVVRNAVGFFGYTVGPDVHVIDELGLGDALMSRLPPVWRPHWRIGHFFRVVPAGYEETLTTGQNRLADPQLAAYYDALALIMKGGLFDRKRWSAIVAMNLGRYDHLIDVDAYRFPGQIQVALLAPALQSQPLEAVAPDGGWSLPETGIELRLPGRTSAEHVEAVLDNAHDYSIVFAADGDEIARQQLWGQPGAEAGLLIHRIAVPRRAIRHEYDQIRILPLDGSGEKTLQRVRVE